MSVALGEAIVKYKGDISDLSTKVKQVKSEMSSVSETAKNSSGGIFSGFKNAAGGVLDFGAKLGQTVIGMQGL